jgi:transposase InsO family protein
MIASTHEHPHVDKRLKPGWYMYWKHQTYRILPFDKQDPLTLYAENTTTTEVCPFHITELWLSESDDEAGPSFAPTLEHLYKEIEKRHPVPNIAPTAGLPAERLIEADHILSVVERVKKLLPVARGELEKRRKEKEKNGEQAKKETDTDVLREACALLKPKSISLSTFYSYETRINTYHGDRAQIAASFIRSDHGKMKLDKATLHFLDTIIPLFLGKRPAEIYRLGESALEYHTQNYWFDPSKCEGPIPADVVDELIKVLEGELPMQALLQNAKTKELLTQIEMPALSLFYDYHRWFLAQPDKGKKALNDLYGKGTWETFFAIFDTFAYRATFPLQYVFADHYLVDVFTIDKATRRKLDRLWLTILIDAYTRCILGAVLLYEEPCIESIQSALLHAIWPKGSLTQYGIDKKWVCFGIPQQLYLDNALAHHSHSLENLARMIGHQGKYHTIDLVFRPPYMARYGALIESLFGHLSGRIKQDLAGAIQSSAPKDLRKAAKEACLLYEDIDRYIKQFIVRYQHTPHKALGGMSPHEKWMESVERIGLPVIPKLDPSVRRLFLREAPDTRKITGKGVCYFGMHYISDTIGSLDTIDKKSQTDKESQKIEYGIRYDPADISTISIYHEEVWKDDLEAKELRLPDGSLKRTSQWELNMAKALAKKNDGCREDWLSYLDDAEELKKRRRAERDRIRRQQKRLAQQGMAEDESVNSEESVEDLPADDDAYLTKLLADFQS